MARTITRLGALPVTMKPPMPTWSPVLTSMRVDRLTVCAAGVGVGVGVGRWRGRRCRRWGRSRAHWGRTTGEEGGGQRDVINPHARCTGCDAAIVSANTPLQLNGLSGGRSRQIDSRCLVGWRRRRPARETAPSHASTDRICKPGRDGGVIAASDKGATSCDNVAKGSTVDANLEHHAVETGIHVVKIPEGQLEIGPRGDGDSRRHQLRNRQPYLCQARRHRSGRDWGSWSR